MFQKSISFEEFNGFSEIDVHFLNERSFFTFFTFPKPFCGSDDHRPSNKPEPLHNDFWDTLYNEADQLYRNILMRESASFIKVFFMIHEPCLGECGVSVISIIKTYNISHLKQNFGRIVC